MDQNKESKNYGIIMVLGSALMYGSYGIWSKFLGHIFGNFFQAWTKAVIILLFLIPLIFIKKEAVKIKKEDRKWLTIVLICTSLTVAPIFYAFNHMDISFASLLFFVSMFLTMNLTSFLFFKEKFNRIKIISFLTAITGLCLIFSFSISLFSVFAVLMAILNGVASGGEMAFSKKLSNQYSPLYLVALCWFFIFITNFLFSLILGEKQITPSLSLPWFWQLCNSFAGLFAFWLIIAGVKYIGVGISAILGLTQVVFSIIFGVVIFNETLTISVGIGALLIIVAAALPNLQGLSFEKDYLKFINKT